MIIFITFHQLLHQKRNADTLRSVQTATAQRIVDEVKRARPMVRLPL